MEVYGEKPKKFTAKWWEYIWEYYKWHFVCVLFIIFTLVTTLHQCATRPDYDLQITAVTERDLVMTQVDMLCEDAESIVTDATGNGVNEVYIMPLTLNPDGDPQIMQVNHTKFMVEMSMPESYVFILSKKFADTVAEGGILESTDVWAGGSADEYVVSLNGNEKLTALGIDTEELYLGVLKLSEDRQKDELEKARYENGVLFAKHLLGLE